MKFTNENLITIIKAYRQNALGFEDGELANERASAMDHYHGRPYGDEEEGRSQVVSRDLSETVDWILPTLIRMFIQSGNIAEFTPTGAEDEPLAEQESDYTNHVIMEDNPGFLVLYDWFKDALLLKNGYVKHYYEEVEKTSEHEYSGLTSDELAYLIAQHEQGGEVEIKEQSEDVIYIQGEMGDIPEVVYDVRLAVTSKEDKFNIEVIPPEEIRVSKRARGSLQDSEFTEHQTRKTRSDLIEMGMPKDFVMSLAAHNERDNDTEDYARDSVYDEQDNVEGLSLDRSLDEIEYTEAYLRIDYNDDGIAELRKIVTVADRIPPGPEWNEQIDCVPITSITPKRVPHRHVGESLDDDLKDLQQIKTVLFRQLLDNVYVINNQQWIVNGRVHLPDFVKSVPGGVKRVKDDLPVAGAVEPIQVTPIMNQILPAIDYVDGVKDNRTGINKQTTGVDPDILKQSTKGAYLENLNRASQKVEMIARMFAETGVKELVLRVHELLIKHHNKPRVIKLNGSYTPVNPQEWKERNNLRVKVGLGTGSEEEKREKLMLLVGIQEKIAQMGLVGPEQGYNMFSDIARALGQEAPERYALDPESPEFQQKMQNQQQPNPLAEAEQIKGQFAVQKTQMEVEMKGQLESFKQQAEYEKQALKEQHAHEMQLLKMEIDERSKALELESKENIEILKAEIELIKAAQSQDLGQPGIGGELSE